MKTTVNQTATVELSEDEFVLIKLSLEHVAETCENNSEFLSSTIERIAILLEDFRQYPEFT